MLNKKIIYFLIIIVGIIIIKFIITSNLTSINTFKNRNAAVEERIKTSNDSIINIMTIKNQALKDSIKVILKEDSVLLGKYRVDIKQLEKEKSQLGKELGKLSNDNLVKLAIKRYEESINN